MGELSPESAPAHRRVTTTLSACPTRSAGRGSMKPPRSCGRSCGAGRRRRVIDDRLPAIEPERRDQLPDPLTRQPRITAKQPMDLVLERIELRPRRRAGIARRHRRTHGRSDRIARQTRPPGELLDRDAAHEVLAAQLGPPLHIDQPLTAPASIATIVRRSGSTRTPPPTRPRGQSSTGGEGSVFTRRRQSRRRSPGSDDAVLLVGQQSPSDWGPT